MIYWATAVSFLHYHQAALNLWVEKKDSAGPAEFDPRWTMGLKLNRKGQAEVEDLFVLLQFKTKPFSAWVTFLCMNSEAHNLV